MPEIALPELTRIVEFADGESWADFFSCAPADLAARLGLRFARVGSAIVAIAPGIDAMLFNRVVGLGFGATLPSHRGRGAQGALMAQRIRDAIALGCRWLATETGEDTLDHPNPSYHNMLRTGFSLVYLRPNYMRAQ